jgi:hypothetical protein
MKGDFTRDTFDPTKHYQQVLMQQGRAQLDADWNEQAELTERRDETIAADVIGNCGGPADGAAFGVSADSSLGEGNFLLSAGHYYVDGILCENESSVAYLAQPDRFDLAALAKSKSYLLYLDVWQRHITAVEDAKIREQALGGPDTATRGKTVWQVRALELSAVDSDNPCGSGDDDFVEIVDPGTARLTADTTHEPVQTDPCVIPPSAGYFGLENQLYRVEIHEPGTASVATWKWSRENGSVITPIEKIDGKKVTVSSLGPDANLGFVQEAWVEILDDALELEGMPGQLVQIDQVDQATRIITLKSDATPLAGGILPERHPKLRRWEGLGAVKGATKSPLENGVVITFDPNGDYRTGHYWQIPARTATAQSASGDIEWPRELDASGQPQKDKPLPQPPRGITHHFCRLGVVTVDANGVVSSTDCRCLWPQLAGPRLAYVSGDGQETMPDLTTPAVRPRLAQPLVVGAFNGQCSDGAVKLRFKCKVGNGLLSLGQLDVLGPAVPPAGATDEVVLPSPNGLVVIHWWLENSPNFPAQQVEVTLFDDAKPSKPLVAPPLRLNANLSIASEVAYDPKQCGSLKDQKTVQKALDQLSALASLYEVSGNGQTIGENETLNPLVVIAANKCGAIAGMKVEFKLISAEGSITPKNGGTTDAAGLASCDWTLGPSFNMQEVEATLEADETHSTVPPAKVRFTAQRRATEGVHPGIHVTDVVLGANGQSLPNDSTVVFDQLEKGGIQIVCDEDVAQETISDKPTCFVTLELPFPVTDADRDFWKPEGLPLMGFQPLILFADANSDNNVIYWIPRNLGWMPKLFVVMKKFKLGDRVLARLTLKGNFIWAAKDPKLFLDGEAFGAPAGKTPTNLLLASGDGQRGGDFEMWFWLVEPTKQKEKEKEKEKEKDKEIKEKDLIDKVKDTDVKVTDVKVTDVKGAEAKAADVPHGAGRRVAAPKKAPRKQASKKKATGRAFIQPDERPKTGPSRSRKPK